MVLSLLQPEGFQLVWVLRLGFLIANSNTTVTLAESKMSPKSNFAGFGARTPHRFEPAWGTLTKRLGRVEIVDGFAVVIVQLEDC